MCNPSFQLKTMCFISQILSDMHVSLHKFGKVSVELHEDVVVHRVDYMCDANEYNTAH